MINFHTLLYGPERISNFTGVTLDWDESLRIKGNLINQGSLYGWMTEGGDTETNISEIRTYLGEGIRWSDLQ